MERENYGLHVAITSAGHMVRFQHRDLVLAEVATSSHHDLPRQSLLLGERIKQPFENRICLGGRISYRCSVKLENVEPKNLFTYNQIIDKADPAHSLIYQFGSNGRIAMGAMSLVKIESRIRQVRIRAIHTFPDNGQVLSSESEFELV